MTLEEIRKRIDAIDAQLLPLFLERMDCAKEVAEIKRKQNLPVFRPEREQLILDAVEQKAGEYAGEAKLLYATILSASRALQHRILGSGEELRNLMECAYHRSVTPSTIACPGVTGSFSHEAALRLFPQAEPLFLPHFSDVFHALSQGKADFGLAPVENSSAGSVSEVYSLILKYRFYIVAALTLPVHHCLAAPKGVTLDQLTNIYSHPQALSQCSQYLSEHNLNPQPYSNTAAAAKMAAEKGGPIGVICSEIAAKEFGLSLLARDIQNSDHNRTRFIAISREPAIPENANKISLCFSLPHVTGSLQGVLARFAAAGLNLTKMESRPIESQDGYNFEYDFYLDFSGNVRQPLISDLLCSLQSELPRFSFLGNYPEQL